MVDEYGTRDGDGVFDMIDHFMTRIWKEVSDEAF
jgi:hypothetical protein